MPEDSIIYGQCLCGVVKFEIVPPTKGSAHCHCSYCRRAHGAPLVTWLTMLDNQFKFINGEEKVNWYQSSEQSSRGFCVVCGSTLFFRSTQAPGEIHVAMANLTDDADRQPAVHVFTDQSVPWLSINDNLEHLPGNHEALSGYGVVKPYQPK